MTLRDIALLVFVMTLAAACDRSTPQDAVTDAGPGECPGADAAGVIDIAPGLTARIISKGHGRAARPGDYADVHTTLWLYDEKAEGGRGTEIWTSGGDRPFQFQLNAGQVIEGWDLGVSCMLVGETRELVIAPELGYGARGKPPVPPNATLLFEIELVRLKSPQDDSKG